MSLIHTIYCVEKKIMIPVGQGYGPVHFWSDPVILARLGRFLEETRGCSLVFASENEEADGMEQCKFFEDDEE